VSAPDPVRSPGSDAFLRLSAVEKHYGPMRALGPIDLTIAKGTFVSLLGPSGCGKTTTLMCIAGFTQPDSGAILLRGHDIIHAAPNHRNFGMVFQSYALFPHLTVSQNVSFGLEMRGIKRAERDQRVAEMLRLVQLTDKGDRLPRQLSGGQQQRVALARAMVINPDLLLLDEPLANLDAVLRDEMRSFIRDIQKRLNLSVVYVTHDQSEALAMSDQVVVMSGGAILQAGAPVAIYNRPASTRVASFIGQSNLFPGQVAGRTGPYTQVDTAVGRLLAEAPEPVASGQSVTLLLRPEALQFGTPPPDRETNIFAGTIRRAAFGGNIWNVSLELENGALLSYLAPPAEALAEDTRVVVWAEPSACALLVR
jgi:putative spermidine/putrescine transport system ATP-binding protein